MPNKALQPTVTKSAKQPTGFAPSAELERWASWQTLQEKQGNTTSSQPVVFAHDPILVVRDSAQQLNRVTRAKHSEPKHGTEFCGERKNIHLQSPISGLENPSGLGYGVHWVSFIAHVFSVAAQPGASGELAALVA
jgi:hypothetical protein